MTAIKRQNGVYVILKQFILQEILLHHDVQHSDTQHYVLICNIQY